MLNPKTANRKVHLPALDDSIYPLCKQTNLRTGIRRLAITMPIAEFIKLDYFIRCEKCFKMNKLVASNMTFIPPEPRNQLINEICKNGLLEEYRDTIIAILEEMFANGAKVSCKYNETASNIDRDRVRPYHIRVSMIEVKDPLNIIWNILHEYGHYLDWPVNKAHSRVDKGRSSLEIC